MSSSDQLDALATIARRHRGLGLLLLHGSRARGDDHAGSDWDLAFLAQIEPSHGSHRAHSRGSADGVDRELLLGDLVAELGTDRVDLADLARSSALLRFRAARDGVCVHEASAGAHERFVLAAALFWCDAEPVIRRAYDGVLAELG